MEIIVGEKYILPETEECEEEVVIVVEIDENNGVAYVEDSDREVIEVPLDQIQASDFF